MKNQFLSNSNIDFKEIKKNKRKVLIITWLTIIIFLAVYLPIVAYFSNKYNINHRVFRYASLPIVLILYNQYRDRKRGFITLYNKTITKNIIGQLQPTWVYQYNKGIDENAAYQSKLIKKSGYYDSSNLTSGDIEGIDFRFSHVETAKKSLLSARLPKVIFRGYFFEFEFPKFTDIPVHVHPPILKDFGSLDGTPPICKMDTAEFDKKFKTYCEDPVQARYILTLSLMSRIIDLGELYNNKISFLFDQNKVYIAINIKGTTIEPTIFKRIKYKKVFELHDDTLKMVRNFIGEMNLQINIWEKEALSK